MNDAPADFVPTTFAEIIGLWRFAEDLARDIGVKGVTVRAWKYRGIPSEYWRDIEAAAIKLGRPVVTVALMADIAARDAGRFKDEPPTDDPDNFGAIQ